MRISQLFVVLLALGSGGVAQLHSQSAKKSSRQARTVTYTGQIRALQLRLVNGTSINNGRLEVLYNGTWGTVCSDGFRYTSAGVVCSILGYGEIGIFMRNFYGSADDSVPIWLSDVVCDGNETSLDDCQHSTFGEHKCHHTKDTSIYCYADHVATPPEALLPVKLVPRPERPNAKNQGRLEVFYNGSWGTVCDDGFDDNDIRVVCRSLGFRPNGFTIDSALLEESSREKELLQEKKIWLDDVKCLGLEHSLATCAHNEFGQHDCEHSEDVTIVCGAVSDRNSERLRTVRRLNPLRLVDGVVPYEGRLEIKIDGTWGTICRDDFNDRTASVACDALGLGSNGHALGNRYGPGKGPIWLNNVRCTGNEDSLLDCRYRGVGFHDCSHREVISIYCGPACVQPTFIERTQPMKNGVPSYDSSTIEECQDACNGRQQCKGFGWTDSYAYGRNRRCYLDIGLPLHNDGDDKVDEKFIDEVVLPLLTYFEKECATCPEIQWMMIKSPSRLGVTYVASDAESVETCKFECASRPGCTGIDFNAVALAGSQCVSVNEDYGVATAQHLTCRSGRRYNLFRDNNLVLRGARLNPDPSSIDACASACLNYIGCDIFQFMLQNEEGTQCWLGGPWIKMAHTVFDETHVYAIISTEDITPIGCFVEKEEYMEFNEMMLQGERDMTLYKCSVACRAQRYAYGAVWRGEFCRCSDNYGKYGRSRFCNVPCTGDRETICGGMWANTVFKTGIDGNDMGMRKKITKERERNCSDAERRICKNGSRCVLTPGETSIACVCEGRWTGGDCSVALPSSKVEEDLLQVLLSNDTGYRTLSRPRSGTGYPTRVNFVTSILKVIDLDEKDEMMKINLQYQLLWIDQRLSWNSKDFDGINRLNIPVRNIWTPEIHLENNALGEGERVGGSAEDRLQRLVNVKSNGLCSWRITDVATTHCAIDVEFFPFDLQVCKLIYRGFLPAEDVDLSIIGAANTAMRTEDTFKGDGQWELHDVIPVRDAEHWNRVEIILYLARRPFYYIFNFIIPCFSFSVICLITFLLPPDSTERIGLGVSLLLGITVYQMIINEKLPETSESIPLLGSYFLFVMITCASSIVMFIITESLHQTTREMSKQMQTIVHAIARATFTKRTVSGRKTNGTGNGLEEKAMRKGEEYATPTRHNESSPSEDPVSTVNSVEDPLLAAIHDIHATIQQALVRKSEEEVEVEKTVWAEDWVTAARVFDRICSTGFAICLVAGSVHFLLSCMAAKEKQLDEIAGRIMH